MPKESEKSEQKPRGPGFVALDPEGKPAIPPKSSDVKSGEGLTVEEVRESSRTVIAKGSGGLVKVICPVNGTMPKVGDKINARLRKNIAGDVVSGILIAK